MWGQRHGPRPAGVVPAGLYGDGPAFHTYGVACEQTAFPDPCCHPKEWAWGMELLRARETFDADLASEAEAVVDHFDPVVRAWVDRK